MLNLKKNVTEIKKRTKPQRKKEREQIQMFLHLVLLPQQQLKREQRKLKRKLQRKRSHLKDQQ